MRNLQEQVKKTFSYQKLFWPLTVLINCSSDFKSFSRSLEHFFSQSVKIILVTKYHFQWLKLRKICGKNWGKQDWLFGGFNVMNKVKIENIFLRLWLINFRLNRTTVGDFFWIIFHIVVTGRVVMSSSIILYSIFWSFRSVFRIQVEFGSVREKFLADLTVRFRRIWARETEVTRQQKIVSFSTRLQMKVKKVR